MFAVWKAAFSLFRETKCLWLILKRFKAYRSFLHRHLGKEKTRKIEVLFFSERVSSGASDKNTRISIHSALWEERIFIDPITMQGGCQIAEGCGKVQLNLRKANGSLTKLIVQGSNSRTSTQGNKQNEAAQVPWQLLQFFITMLFIFDFPKLITSWRIIINFEKFFRNLRSVW